MDPRDLILTIAAAVVSVVVTVLWLSRRASIESLSARIDEDDVDGRPRLSATGFRDIALPWANRPDVGRFQLEAGVDSFVYQHAERDNEGHIVQPEIVYTRYSVIALGERLPSLRSVVADASPGFARLAREMAKVDDFPSPEGLGIAFVGQQVEHDVDHALRYQQLIDLAWCRMVGEQDTVSWLRHRAIDVGPHGAICARLLLEHLPAVAIDDGLPVLWCREGAYPRTALAASLALLGTDDDPLFELAVGRRISAERTAVMEDAWSALARAGALSPDRLLAALDGADAPTVFEDAGRRAIAAGLPDIEPRLVQAVARRATHRRAAFRLMGRLPASEADAVLVDWMGRSDTVRTEAAEALHARGSDRGSALLASLLESQHDGDVDFALTWLGRLGAPDAVGALRRLTEGWLARGERVQQAEAAIAGILARSGATDGALTFADGTEGGLSVAADD